MAKTAAARKVAKNVAKSPDKNELLFLLAASLIFILVAVFGFSYSIGENYANVSVDTRVNITNSKPELMGVTIEAGAGNISLIAGSPRFVECNATIRDWNGGDTITNVSGVFYDNQSTNHSAPDDNNDHYSNSSCASWRVDGYYNYYTCTFAVRHYANASTQWICNVSVTDDYDFNGTDSDWNYNVTEIFSLYALNVTPIIDYGEMAVEDVSGAKQANVTNLGNRPINVSVYGYGNESGDGLAMVCDIGNITVENEKYGLNGSAEFTSYTALTASAVHIEGLTIARQTNDSAEVTNTTYWRLYVPPNPSGICNGTVVFQAESVD